MNFFRRPRMALVAAITLGGCPATSDPPSTEALFRADSAFAAATAARGAEGWASFFAADGVMFPATGQVKGRAEILEAMRDNLGPNLPTLEWIPLTAELAESEDVGYTTGRWRSVSPDDGSIVASGLYLTVWRLTSEGWRVAADIGNRDSLPRDF